MKITEAMRRKKAWEMIQETAEEASENRGSKADEALNFIFRIAHTMASPGCRRNHSAWTRSLDAAIRARRKGK